MNEWRNSICKTAKIIQRGVNESIIVKTEGYRPKIEIDNAIEMCTLE